MADMELLLVYAWWRSLCVQEKGEVFATESTEEHGKMKRKGLFCHEIHEKTRTKIYYEKKKSFLSFPFVFFRGFRGKKISKSFLSVFFRGFRGKKTKTRLLALINAKVQCLSLAGLRIGRAWCRER